MVSVDSDGPARLGRVLPELLLHPIHSFIAGWNWKAAALSIILRAPIYIATSIRYGWEAASFAGLVEAIFAALVAGVYAALTQAIRFAEPQFVVAALLVVVLPTITLGLDALLHYVMHTPNLVAGVSVSLVVSVLSSTFNWYSMRRGTLLLGPAARPFAADIMALPLLIARFASEPLILLWRSVKSVCTALG